MSILHIVRINKIIKYIILETKGENVMQQYKEIQISIKGIVFFSIITLICFIVLNNVIVLNADNFCVIIMFLVNAFIICLNMVKKSSHGYSIEEIVWVFMFLFMFLAPVVQFCLGKFPWWNSNEITTEIVFESNLVILLFICMFMFSNLFLKSNFKKRYSKTIFYYKKIEFILNLSFIISVIFSLIYISNVGFYNLFARSTNGFHIDNSAVSLIISCMFCSFPAISLSLNMYYKRIKGHSNSRIQVIILLILTVLINFPTGKPRYQCAVIYIGLIILYKKDFVNKYIFKLVIVFGMIILFPVLNFFRYNTYNDLTQFSQYQINFSNDLLEGDYDSFSMLCRCLIYKDKYDISFGSQILGNIFFFIPRSVWPDKPIGSGAMIGEKLGWIFTNVSCPYIGEGYINFGLIGVVLFAIMFSYVSTYCQVEYDKSLSTNENKFKITNVIYPFLPGFAFFIMRGDLLSSISYLIGFVSPAIILYFFDIIIPKKI